MNKEELLDFEKNVKQLYLDGKLRSPVHLSGGDEEQLINIFRTLNIGKDDWLFTTYRSHYHALLKGVPKQRLVDWILDNKSIHFMDKEYNIFSSAIVGGTLPIAVGTAMAIKKKKENKKVFVFIGDMTAMLGVFHDCVNYSISHNLPIHFIIADNGLSTDTKTAEVWNINTFSLLYGLALTFPEYVTYYKYERIYPHYGVGQFVDFPEDKKELIQDGTKF